MTDPQQWLTTPVGRLVEGNPMEEQTTKYGGGPLLSQQTGLPYSQWFMGLAIPKGPECDAFRAQIAQLAQQAWPQGQSQGANFAWKIEDGDGLKQQGKEGRAGHWIFRMNTTLGAPKAYMDDAAFTQIIDPNFLKRGFFMRVQVGIKSNNNAEKPGIYLNLGGIQFKGYGPEIFSGPTPQEMFAQPAAMPAGASATPVAAAPMPVMPGQQPVAAVAPVMPGQVPAAALVMPGQQPVAAVAPVMPAVMPGVVPAALPLQPGQPGYVAPVAALPLQPGQPGYVAPAVGGNFLYNTPTAKDDIPF